MKKLISLFISLSMLLAVASPSAALFDNGLYSDVVYRDQLVVGDADGDGELDMKDSLCLKVHCASGNVADENASDINADGIVNAKDLLILKKCLADLDDISLYDVSDNAVHKMYIGGNDIGDFCVIYNPDAKSADINHLAAEILSKYICAATGVELSVSTEQISAHKIEFVCNEALNADEYKYEVSEGDLIITSSYRGSLYAVYDILEEYLGYRFYSDNLTYHLEQHSVSIKEGTSSVASPYLSFRFADTDFDKNSLGHFYPRHLNGSLTQFENSNITQLGPLVYETAPLDFYIKMATGKVDVQYDGSNGLAYEAKYSQGRDYEESTGYCATDEYIYASVFRGILESLRYVKAWKPLDEEALIVSVVADADDAYYICPCRTCSYIAKDGMDRTDGERLGLGGDGLFLYFANRVARDIVEYYDGRASGIKEYGDGEFSEYGYGEAITDAYPNARVYTELYYHNAPKEDFLTDERYRNVVPEENLVILWEASACNNHYLSSGECEGSYNILRVCPAEENSAMKAWGEVIKETGAEFWLGYYASSMVTYLSDSPNIFNIWYDFSYAVEECNITGFKVMGKADGYLFESLKSHLASEFMWSVQYDENGEPTYMSYDEFIAEIKEYLYLVYGEGYEYVYEYILMQDEAGNLCSTGMIDEYGWPIEDENGNIIEGIVCFTNIIDYPGDMYDYEYIRGNYEHMRSLITSALEFAEGDEVKRLEYLLVNCDLLGLSACHKSWYLESEDEEQKNLYVERYTALYNYIVENDIKLDVEGNRPAELDVSKSPMIIFYNGGSWRVTNADTWTQHKRDIVWI